MLINLRTLYKPISLIEAADLLEKPGVRALYGGSLVRENAKIVDAAVDLSALGLTRIDLDGNTLHIGSCATLEAIRLVCADLPSLLAAAFTEVLTVEVPLTLRNALTIGDILTEARANSPLLTLIAALPDRIQIRKQGALIEALVLTLETSDQRESVGFAFEKVARTPADAPIVGAFAWIEGDVERVAVCGLMQQPTVYTFGMPSQLSDYLGSADYRTEMAKVLARRTLERASAMAGLIGQ